ncbi:hypothetical protein F9817_10540 [Vibrio sp. CAIM 722]|uniref:Lumazine-binding domain-containing protein n=1 Tax=Vibrio eleionomae TaxID=2653505 RepID=A0A7X4RU92_9VIBR|nr:hypothetical protein [Vibrio eleionomae]MZI93636.1 hypothetical protein [Vibrio eleionomae]
MFTGLVQSVAKVTGVSQVDGGVQFTLQCHHDFYQGLGFGADVVIDGVRFMVVDCLDNDSAVFELLSADFYSTTLCLCDIGSIVHVSLAQESLQDDKIRLLKGDIDFQAQIIDVSYHEQRYSLMLSFPVAWKRYIFVGGYLAVNGASVTITQVDEQEGWFSVHSAMNGARVPLFEHKFSGDSVNIEVIRGSEQAVSALEESLSEVLGELYPAVGKLLNLQGIDMNYLACRARAKMLDTLEDA